MGCGKNSLAKDTRCSHAFDSNYNLHSGLIQTACITFVPSRLGVDVRIIWLDVPPSPNDMSRSRSSGWKSSSSSDESWCGKSANERYQESLNMHILHLVVQQCATECRLFSHQGSLIQGTSSDSHQLIEPHDNLWKQARVMRGK
jgi:hypothetical protein